MLGLLPLFLEILKWLNLIVLAPWYLLAILILLSPLYIVYWFFTYPLGGDKKEASEVKMLSSFRQDWKRSIMLLLIAALFVGAVSSLFIPPEKCPAPQVCTQGPCFYGPYCCCDSQNTSVFYRLSCYCAVIKAILPILCLILISIGLAFYILRKTFSEKEAFVVFGRKILCVRLFTFLSALFLVLGILLLIVGSIVDKLLSVFVVS
jgi:hypothetical protein